jgi:4-amino-4-deoxy-L-arabinose transferase-like glycosyltransferase
MLIPFKIILILLIIYLPGYIFQSLFFLLRNKKDNDIWELEDIIFLRILIGFSFLTLIGLLLIFAGLFTPIILIIVFSISIVGFILTRYLLAKRGKYTQVTISKHQLGTLFILIIAFIIWSKPSEYIFGGWDPGVYINYGVLIAKSGSVNWHNKTITLIPSERQAPFYHLRNRMRQLFPGFILSNPKTGKFIPYFMPTYPLWIAIFYMIFNTEGTFYTTVFISLLGLLALYSIGKITFGKAGAFIIAILAIFNVGMLWFSGFPNSESLSRLFLLGSIYAFILWARREKPVLFWGGLGSICLYLAFSVKYTPFILLPAFLLYFFISPIHISFFRRLIWSVIIFGIAAASWFSHAEIIPHHTQLNFYVLLHIFTKLQVGVLSYPYKSVFLSAFIIGVVIIWWNSKSKEKMETILSIIITLIITLIIFLQLSNAIKEVSLIQKHSPSKEIVWYISWPGLIIGFLGLWFFALKGEKGIKSLLILIFSSQLIMFTINPMVESFHFWAGRRLVEIIIPFILIFIGYLIASVYGEGVWRKSIGRVLILIIIIPMLYSIKPILFHNDYSGAKDFVKKISKMVPEKGVVVTGGGWWKLATPLNMIYGINSLQFSDPDEIKTDILLKNFRSLLKMGIPVYYITDISITPGVADKVEFKLLKHLVYETKVFKQTKGSLPRSRNLFHAGLYLYKIIQYKSDRNRKMNNIYVDIGKNPFGLEGFSTPRSFKYPSSFFRWTGSYATLEINTCNWSSLEQITIFGASRRPKGVPNAEVKLYINEYHIASFEIPRDKDFTSYNFTIDSLPLGPVTKIYLKTSTWLPKDILKSQDNRELGVQIEYIRLKGRDKKGESVELKIKTKNLPRRAKGWFLPEFSGFTRREYRYIDRVGLIQIPWSKDYHPKYLSIFTGTHDVAEEAILKIYLDEQFIGCLSIRGDFREYIIQLKKEITREVNRRTLRLVPEKIRGISKEEKNRKIIKIDWIKFEEDYKTCEDDERKSIVNMETENYICGNIKDEVIMGFGSNYGVLVFYNNSRWEKLHKLSPEEIVTGDLDGNGKDEVIIDFGSNYGVWVLYNNSRWEKLHKLSPEEIVTGDLDGNDMEDVIMDLGPLYGVLVFYNNSRWEKLYKLSPEEIVTGDLDGNGKDEVIMGFGSNYGVLVFYNNSRWEKLHKLSPEEIVTGDLDGNDMKDVIMDFGPLYGVLCWYNNARWRELYRLSPDIISTGNIK